MVMDIFGSSIKSTHTAPPIARTASTLRNLRISDLLANEAIAITIKNLAYSEG